MVVLWLQSWFVERAGHRLKDAFLRLADNLTLGVEPRQHVKIIIGSGISNDTILDSTMSLFGGISNIGYLWDDAFQLRVGIGGVFPNLECL